MTTATGKHHQNRGGAHHSRALRFLGTSAAFLLPEGSALAQEFVKIADGSREQLPATPFVGLAYGFIWLAIFLYVWYLARELSRVDRALNQLQRRLERPDSSSDRRSSVGIGR